MPFDPSKPFTVIAPAESAFDPTKPFAVVKDDEPKPEQSYLGDKLRRVGRSLTRMPGDVVTSVGGALDAAERLMRASNATEAAVADTLAGKDADPMEANRREIERAGKAGRAVQKVGREMRERPNFAGLDVAYTGNLAPDPARDQELLSQAADSTGSLAAAMATPGGVVTKTIMGALLQASGQAEQAREKLLAAGKSEDEADTEAAFQYVANLPAGALEALPWGGLMKRFGGKNILDAVDHRFGRTAVRRLAKTILEQAGSEGGEEMAQQLWGNLTARHYDPKQKLGEGVLQAGAVGALMGAGLGGTLQAGAELAGKGGDDTGRNLPERPEDLKAQQAQLVRGDRAVQMFPTGTAELPLPEGMKRVRTPRGVFHFDPRRMTADEIYSKSKAGKENELLGLGPVDKAEIQRRVAAGEPVAVVTERGPNGEELRGALTTPSTAPETTAAMEQGKSKGSTVQVEPLAETLAKRDILADIERDLPNGDGKDYLRGRTRQSLQQQAQVETDLPALWKQTVDAVLAAGVSPKEFSALDRNLELLADKEGRKRAGLKGKVTPERITAMLGNTVLDGALRGSAFTRLRDALAADPANIDALREEFAKAREQTAGPIPGQSPAPAATGETPPVPAPRPFRLPPALAGAKPRYGYKENLYELNFENDLDKALYIVAQAKPSKQDAQYLRAVTEQTGLSEAEARAAGRRVRERIKGLAQRFPLGGKLTVTDETAEANRARLREQIAAEAEQERKNREEIDRKKATAEQALADAAEKRKAESIRLAAIDRTGRDPESGLIAELAKVPDRELENFDWEKDRYLHDGSEVRPEDIEALLMQRAEAEERAAATNDNATGYTLAGLLKGKPDELRAAGLSKPLRLLSPKEAKERGSLGGEHAALRERTGGFAYFSRAGLAEDGLQEQLAGLGFDVPDVNAAYALVERAMNGERITPTSGGDAGAQFARRESPQVNTPEFKRWFGGSKTVDATGEPLRLYHGAQRADRINNRFRKNRATSGPMAFFTDNPEIASKYATGKQDTSIEVPNDYSGWFRYKGKGMRSAVSIDRAWWMLTPEERAHISDRIYTTGYQNAEEGTGPIVGNSSSIMGRQSIDYELRQARGNGLRALTEIWLNSGSLFDDEVQFMSVLKAVGMDMTKVEFDHPLRSQSGVFPVYLAIKHPLITSAIPDAVYDRLEQAGKGKRAKSAAGANFDAWDKNMINGKDWLQILADDRTQATDHAWTRIPDWVTSTLKELGYDGIHDTGGKGGGETHSVWIPFEETQIKSATGNRGTFDPTNPRIDYAQRERAPADTMPLARRAEQWLANLRRIAPGLAQEAELRFGETEDLVEQGLARRDDLTGEEEAARWRDRRAKREIFYLFERALRRNTDAQTRLNLQHEMGHAFWDTLDRHTQERLHELFAREIETKTGPLFDAEGKPREGVALGATEDVQEWFAERLAHANDVWAQRRLATTARGDTLMATLAAQFRQLLLRLRELVEKHRRTGGYDDALLANFREFLNQGAKWTGDQARARVEFARRTGGDDRVPEVKRRLITERGNEAVSIVRATPPENFEQDALDWAKDHLQGEMLDNPDTGFKGKVSGKSLKKMLEQRKGFAREHAAAAYSLEKLMTQAKGLAMPGDPDDPTVTRTVFMFAPMEFEGRVYRVKLTGKEFTDAKNPKLHSYRIEDVVVEKEEAPPSKFARVEGDSQLTSGPSAVPAMTLGELLAKGKPEVQFAKRARAKTDAEFDEALRNFDRLERERDRQVEQTGKADRELLAQLSEARMELENSWPGWRETQQEQRAEREANATAPTEPEPGAAMPEEGRIPPQVTQAKITQVTSASFRPVSGVREWLGMLGKLFTNFRSSLPELPGGAKGRVFTRFRQGYRMLKAATENVRRQAEDRVAHVLEPITNLGPGAIAPAKYRRLQNLAAAIRQLGEADPLANGEAIARLGRERAALEKELENLPYHLFRKTVLFRDLWFRSKLLNESGDPISLPGYLTRGEIEAELARLHTMIEAHPDRTAIEESLRRHYDLVNTMRDDLLARGYIIPEEVRNPLYFPHLILDKFNGRLQSVKLDTAEDFRSYLQQLSGSAKDVESDYLTAMYYHMGQVMAHNARQDIVETYWQPYDKTPELKTELRRINAQRADQGLGPLVIEQIKDKDDVIYTVDDRIPLRPEYVINRGVLAQRLGVALGEGDLQAQLREQGLNVTITAADIEMAMGAGEKTKWIVPRPVAAALDAMVERDTNSRKQLQRALAKPQSWWKWYKLFAPTSVIRYTYGNLAADVEKLFSADPRVFLNLLPAYREVKAFFRGGEPSADLREAFRHGVISTVTAGEVGELKHAERFETYLSSREKLLGMLGRGVQWGAKLNELREAAFRYAKFKTDLERLRRGERPVYAGAYHKDVEAITDSRPGANDAIYAKAAEIARKTFVDYDDISVSGDALRKYWVPFYSWMEGNFRYHANLFRNLGDMSVGAGMSQLARGGLVTASKVVLPRTVTGVLLRLALPYVAASLWNNSGDREELEKTLSEEDQRRFHIILGKDAQGKTVVVYAPTALADVAEWFGGNDFARLAGDYMHGRITLHQLAHDWLADTPAATLNKGVQGLNPFFKTMLEFAARKNFFPDVTDARTIADYDLGWHVLGNMTDLPTANAIRSLLDKDDYSSRSGWEWAQQLILQARRRDPEQWGYYATLDRVDAWQKAHGGVVDFGANNRDDAELLRNFRRTIRAADVPAAIQFYHKLLAAGYTAERFAASVRASDPLQTVKREHRQEFYDSLNPAEQHDVQNAYRYAQRMEAFKHHERQLFPAKKASDAYKKRFAETPRDDVFTGLMLHAAERSDDEEELRAEKLLHRALLPR